MYYDEYRKKRKRRRRRGGCLGAIGHFFGRLLCMALVLAVLSAVGLYFLPVELFMVEPDSDVSVCQELPASPLNVLLLGVDALADGYQRSDTMIVASIGQGSVKLTSLQRDTLVEVPGHGEMKLNAAYACGGPELAMRTVNENFGLNIVKYAVVDFTALVQMVDALGGVDIDVTEGEMEHINRNIALSGPVFAPLGYTPTFLYAYGEDLRLDGLQALAYARIRKLDSDFMRTSRQRTVIEAMLARLKGRLWNPVSVTGFVRAGLDGIDTNLNAVQLISLGEKALLAGGVEQLRLPVDGTFLDDGSALTITDRQKNIAAFRSFVYAEQQQ